MQLDKMPDKAVVARLRQRQSEHDLAVALDAYTDPTHPEYDADFTDKIGQLRPEWIVQLAAERLKRRGSK